MQEMKAKLREDAEKIYEYAIESCLPDSVVKEALKSFCLPRGRLVLVSIGKAAWRMARCAVDYVENELFGKVDCGVVITKYGHSEGKIHGVDIYEAAHPIPDANCVLATEEVLKMTDGLSEDDAVLFLVSGGGSALFESPYCKLSELSELTGELLASGADINEINAVRKHISKVKGGRFAKHIYPARVFAVVLSDVLGNRLDTIASGPCAPDMSSIEDVKDILGKYKIKISDALYQLLMNETPKEITNATHFVSGSVAELCRAAKRMADELGYKSEIITDNEQGIAREVGTRLARAAVDKRDSDVPIALIIGGEPVVKLKGNGLGGRNQELVLSASLLISGNDNIAVFSVGSDGTDGPTDAAGGIVFGDSYISMEKSEINPLLALENNDSYNALSAIGGLITTGPTGTNVNDVAVALIRVRDYSRLDKTRRFFNL